MPTIAAFNATIKNIVSEVEKFDAIEQESILAYLRARRIKKLPKRNFAATAKPLTMATIDAIKHKSRLSADK